MLKANTSRIQFQYPSCFGGAFIFQAVSESKTTAQSVDCIIVKNSWWYSYNVNRETKKLQGLDDLMSYPNYRILARLDMDGQPSCSAKIHKRLLTWNLPKLFENNAMSNWWSWGSFARPSRRPQDFFVFWPSCWLSRMLQWELPLQCWVVEAPKLISLRQCHETGKYKSNKTKMIFFRTNSFFISLFSKKAMPL